MPVEARVAAILRATWPHLPMPVTMTRPPRAEEPRRRPRRRRSPTRRARRAAPSASACMTRRAAGRRRARTASRSAASSRSAARAVPPSRHDLRFRPTYRSTRRSARRSTRRGRTRRCRHGAASVGEDVVLGPAGQVEPARAAGSRSRPAASRCGPRAPAWRPAPRGAGAGEGRRRRHTRAARRQLGRAPVRVCCCFEMSTPSSSRHEVLQPVPVGVGAREREAILVQ